MRRARTRGDGPTGQSSGGTRQKPPAEHGISGATTLFGDTLPIGPPRTWRKTVESSTVASCRAPLRDRAMGEGRHDGAARKGRPVVKGSEGHYLRATGTVVKRGATSETRCAAAGCGALAHRTRGGGGGGGGDRGHTPSLALEHELRGPVGRVGGGGLWCPR